MLFFCRLLFVVCKLVVQAFEPGKMFVCKAAKEHWTRNCALRHCSQSSSKSAAMRIRPIWNLDLLNYGTFMDRSVFTLFEALRIIRLTYRYKKKRWTARTFERRYSILDGQLVVNLSSRKTCPAVRHINK